MTERPDYIAAFQADEEARANRPAPWDPDPADSSTPAGDAGEWTDGVPLPDEPPADGYPAARPDNPRAAAPTDHNRLPAVSSRIKVTRLSEVSPRRIEWLERDWLPVGSVAIMAGREGIGKSTVAVDIAARATRGKLDNGEPINVAYIVTEDSIDYTVVPRLMAAGADMERMISLSVTVNDPADPTDPNGEWIEYDRPLQLPDDMPTVERVLKGENVQLVILDAAKSVMNPELSDNKEIDVRKYLERISKVATDNGITFLGLAHHSAKIESLDGGKKLLGSSAWSQVPRTVLAIAEDPNTGTVCVWNDKTNLTPRKRTKEARIESAPVTVADGGTAEVGRVEWLGERDAPPLELLAPDRDDESRTEAEEWLEDYLVQNGPCLRSDVIAAALKQKVGSEATIKRAFKSIGGTSKTGGMPRRAHWSLPGRGYTGTATAPPEPDTGTALRAAILDTLDTDHPLTETETVRTVTESVKGVTREDVTHALSDMTAAGTIHYVNGKYTKPPKE